jgi:hypothetical protein
MLVSDYSLIYSYEWLTGQDFMKYFYLSLQSRSKISREGKGREGKGREGKGRLI